MPIHTAGAYVITTSERAKDLKQKPVYVLGHAGAGEVHGEQYSGIRFRSMFETLEGQLPERTPVDPGYPPLIYKRQFVPPKDMVVEPKP